ncbi:GNAT family N-acetyltransferase [Lacticaseibacillus mingshuiensis]|uniref:GNAT family N-acetyltransferase n=1 Tax=Lacticaseibacillus mingshuiensis TaxID=2799574 RepID=A0ABW4CKM4_9LACO|nr:GNAT family N-acetyltransferase [Lacticaseibacillus mingshuiensis]
MEFEHEPGRYFLTDDNGKLIAEVTYQDIDDGQNFVIDHTFVDSSLRGQGIAGKLVRAVVDEARATGKKIEPLCTFARHEFDTKAEYADVLREPKGV